ncbi:hypothetical protein ACJ41O_003517 [Fusarium nematophilum]
MIQDKWRYFAPGGAIFPRGPSTWYILDWDQRRTITVTMDEYQEEEDQAITHLKKHIDKLGPDVVGIHVAPDGELLSVSTNPDEDQTMAVYYPPLDEIRKPAWGVKTILRSELHERDRFGPNVDLVAYSSDSSHEPKLAVFKYYFLAQFIYFVWNEMNLWMRLPPHPNIVSFDRLVLDEKEGRVVGFTTVFIPGGTLEENKSRVFKLQWLKQLTAVVDDLNLKYGIMHQDIAPRNLLVCPNTDNLMLFDFNYSGRIGDSGQGGEDRSDVKGVIFTIYEIITRDQHFRQVPHDQQNPADIQDLNEWAKHPEVKLDHPVMEFHSVLDEWVRKRREGSKITLYTDAPECIDWPDLVELVREYKFQDRQGNPGTTKEKVVSELRRIEQAEGRTVVTWERPMQSKIEAGTHVLATGEVVKDK